MTPDVVLNLGDCMAPNGLPSLPDRSVDVTITDPAFDERTHRAAVEVGDWHAGAREVAGALPFQALDELTMARVAAEVARVTKRWILVFCAERQIEAWARALEAGGARFVRVGVAERSNPRPQMTGDRPAPPADYLVIAHAAGPGRWRWNGGGRPARWTAPAARFDDGTHGPRLHPTRKSVRLMRQLVADFSDPGETVIDPFMGSGSTGEACRMLGRAFAGWEIDPTYHAIAVERVASAKQLDLISLAALHRPARRRAPAPAPAAVGLLNLGAAPPAAPGEGEP